MKKYIPHTIIATLLVLLFLFQKCDSDRAQRLKGEYNILKENLQKEKEIVVEYKKIRKIEKDSLLREISKRELTNKTLILHNNSIKDNIAHIKSKPIIISNDLQGIVEYFNYNFKTNSTKAVYDNVALDLETAISVAYNIEDGKRCFLTDSLRSVQIDNLTVIVDNLESDKKNLLSLNFSAEKEIKQQETLQQASDKSINNLETQVKTLKRKNTWNTILSISAILGAGVLGYEIGK